MSTQTRSATERTELPTKSKLLAALLAISGVLSIPMGFLFLSASSSLGGAAANGMAALSTTLAVVAFVHAGISLALAYGLWTARTWSWYGTVGFVSLGVLTGLWAILRGGSLPWYSIAIGLAMLWALWDDQRAFGVQHELPV